MTTYKDAGVDIDAANTGLKKVKKHAKTTFNKYTLSDIGSFGGCFSFPKDDYSNPVLVSSVDGVGTKLLLANSSRNTILFLLSINFNKSLISPSVK